MTPGDALRRQRRRELDSRRSKARVRLGPCQGVWGQLKDKLGFSLHSELAQHLLDSYFSKRCATSSDGTNKDTAHMLVTSVGSLHRLVLLVHDHSQQCPHPPSIQPDTPTGTHTPDVKGATTRATPQFHQGQENQMRGTQPLLPRTGFKDALSPAGEVSVCSWREEKSGAGVVEKESSMCFLCEGGHLLSWLPSGGSGEDVARTHLNQGEETGNDEPVISFLCTELGGRKRRRVESKRKRKNLVTSVAVRASGGLTGSVMEDKAEVEAQQLGEDVVDEAKSNSEQLHIAESHHAQVCTGGCDPQPPQSLTLSDGCLPLDPGRSDPDSDQAGSDNITEGKDPPSPNRWQQADTPNLIVCKKKRKNTAKAILPCDFEGCGKIFSSRQYLNHHTKYLHLQQRTFTCSQSSCGKSFNFKKHLKEHEKLHSNQRDFICEICARAFRTNSHLQVHNRIHTGEKPLQCEVCGFTCRQKASLNWHMRKHGAETRYDFPCGVCGRRFEKHYNLAAHQRKSHPDQSPALHTSSATDSTSHQCEVASIPPV